MMLTDVPEGLGEGGRGVWEAMHDELADGVVFDARELELLHAACRLRDRLDELHATVAEQGATTLGSQGQVVAHPGLSSIGALSAQFRLLLSAVSTDPDERAHGARSVSGRRGANRRWTAERAAVRSIRGEAS